MLIEMFEIVLLDQQNEVVFVPATEDETRVLKLVRYYHLLNEAVELGLSDPEMTAKWKRLERTLVMRGIIDPPDGN